jgi:hypothetical protein
MKIIEIVAKTSDATLPLKPPRAIMSGHMPKHNPATSAITLELSIADNLSFCF